MSTATDNAAVTYAACASCSTVNRVHLDQASGKQPICAKCKQPLPVHGAVSELTGSGLAALVAKSPVPVVVDFWAEWCGPCKMFAPAFERAAAQLAGKAALAKLDTERHQAAASGFQVRSIPTLIVFKDGREVARQSGALPLPAFLSWVQDSIR